MLCAGRIARGYLLNKNIQINGLDNIFAYCLAFNDKTLIDVLNLSSFEFGAALSSFAVEQNYNGELFTPIFKQGTLGYSLDELGRAANTARCKTAIYRYRT